MFTGLIEDMGRALSLERQGLAGFLKIETSLPLSEIAIGDSVAVNGVCLSVTSKQDRALTFDVSPESLKITNLGDLRRGSAVNLERALRLGDRMGGHIVSGHIDCIGRLSRSGELSGNRVMEFSLPSENARYLVSKGSVTIDGVSLTVNTVAQTSFSVNIIPQTQATSNLSAITIGAKVNIETDLIAKYVERLTQPWRGKNGLTIKTLAENGFI